ncbi:MAG TPA: FkbM family methyltransferase, partial [Chthoniobacteraceae bacterium]|nr:FkbM family methyltransferase [Chthoniobacteraceae bacterium]
RATFHLPGGDDGQASMRRHHSGSWATQGGSSAGDAAATRTYECAIRRLDDYAAGMGRLDFVKCDVEGAELAVIQGGAKTLERLFPMLFLETNPAWTKSFGYSPGDLVSAVRGLGYDTILIAEERLVPFAGAEIMGSVNLLCANSKIHAERLRFLDGL